MSNPKENDLVVSTLFLKSQHSLSPEPQEPGLKQKVTQGMKSSSFPLIVVPMIFLLGVALIDAATERSVSTLYKISVSHCCVGLIGWVLALRNKIGPLQFALGDADSWQKLLPFLLFGRVSKRVNPGGCFGHFTVQAEGLADSSRSVAAQRRPPVNWRSPQHPGNGVPEP